jgi:hypothetical protein
MGARGIGAKTTRAAISSIAAAVHDVWASSLIFYFFCDLQESNLNGIRACLGSAYVSIRQHTSAYVSIRQHTSAYVSIRQHT